ncbi:MAG: Uma2 family endonuclease [Myxococcales bacterium]
MLSLCQDASRLYFDVARFRRRNRAQASAGVRRWAALLHQQHAVLRSSHGDTTCTASSRAPDVALVGDLVRPKNQVYRGIPILAVEVRGTQSKRYFEEKVKLYLEHDWPNTWMVHAERQEVEVLPVNALFDPAEARRCNYGWVARKS